MVEEGVKWSAAQKISINMVLSGRYISQEGWNPSYVLTREDRKVERFNIVGIVTIAPSNTQNAQFVIDDGSGSLTIYTFNTTQEIFIGECVQIIGRPWLSEGNMCAVAEIIKRMDPKWMEVRKAELKPTSQDSISIEEKEVVELTKPKGEAVLETIKSLDEGDGAEIDAILAELKRKAILNGEESINQLLRDGEIFESRKGKVKLID